MVLPIRAFLGWLSLTVLTMSALGLSGEMFDLECEKSRHRGWRKVIQVDYARVKVVAGFE